jgi:hypothetical protein
MTIPVGKHNWAIVDEDDYEVLSKRKWHLTGGGYAATSTRGGGSWFMHRMILQPPEDKETDHKNRNKLDNRRSNLRVCTRKQNCANVNAPEIPGKSSRFKGVYFRPDRQCWRAYVGTDKRSLGCYGSEEEAAFAYNLEARRRFGEFACLNQISVTGEQRVRIARKLNRRRRAKQKEAGQ